MSHNRAINPEIAEANRKVLITQLKKKMAERKVEPEKYFQSRINPEIFFHPTSKKSGKPDEAAFHLVGNETQRAIFIEYIDRTARVFELYIIDTSTTTSNKDYSFIKQDLSLLDARHTYLTKGFHFFSYCLPIDKILDAVKELLRGRYTLNEIDSSINTMLEKLFKLNGKNDYLSLFEPTNAKPISSAMTRYDLALECWHQPLTNTFKEVTNENARRLLQTLNSYAKNGGLFSLHPKRHHCSEITKIVQPYKNLPSLDNFAPVVSTFAERARLRPALLQEEKLFIPLEESLCSAKVISILQDLITAIEASKEPTIKPHGDLFALLNVACDMSQINYHAIQPKIANPLLSGLNA